MAKQANKRRRSQHLTVSLFPFLAVLICTLGVLIVLLVISVESAAVESEGYKTAIHQQQQTQLLQLKQQAQMQAFEADNVLSVRSEVSQRLATAKADRSYLQQQIKATETQAVQLLNKYRQLQALGKNAESKAGEASDADEMLVKLQRKISAAQSELEYLRRQGTEKGGQVKFRIAPYDGSGGTNRVPIFVECDGEGLIIQPHGIRLKKTDFVNPNVIGNVLDSALLAIRDYYAKHELTDDETQPYPLLVVRPQGAWSYSLARRAMKSWDDEFGYELVESQVGLQFGRSDPALKSVIKTAIQDAQVRQRRQATGSRARHKLAFGTVYQGDRGSAFARQYDAGSNTADTIRQATAHNRTQTESTFDPAVDRKSGTAKTQLASTKGLSQRSQRTPNVAVNAAVNAAGNRGGIEQSDAGKDRPAGDFKSAGGSPVGSAERPLAGGRGANWALPTSSSNAHAYIRPIRLVCEAEQFVMLERNRVVARIPIEGPTRTAVDALVAEVWKAIDYWGTAGQGAYWKPALRFSVMPGGEQRLADLQTLMKQSGLIVEVAE